MSEYATYNLLAGTRTPQIDNPNYMVADYRPAKPLALGTAYTISYDVQKIECSGPDDLNIYASVDNGYTGACLISVPGPGHYSKTFILTGRNEDHKSDNIQLYNTVPGSRGTARKCSLSHVMLVEGSTPAAWAPAEGETLAGGGGASMSANLLDGVSPVLIRGVSLGADGEFSFSTYSGPYNERQLVYELPDKWKLDANQAFHFGVSAIAEGGTSELFVKLSYSDSAGNTNKTIAKIVVTTTYARYEASLVIPSGMTVGDLLLSRGLNAKHIKIQPPTLSYGGPVTLASSAHTPYATQDHVAAEYSTKASQKILSDSITSEVKARAKTDGAVSELSTKMEQTVNGINVSLDKLTATERQIHSWFDFGSDASGNPKLAMGSSSSPIIGEYSNTGTTYKSRSGATLLALDAANSTTTADHVVAKDMTVGKWKWVPTNGGDNLTLVWIGG